MSTVVDIYTRLLPTLVHYRIASILIALWLLIRFLFSVVSGLSRICWRFLANLGGRFIVRRILVLLLPNARPAFIPDSTMPLNELQLQTNFVRDRSSRFLQLLLQLLLFKSHSGKIFRFLESENLLKNKFRGLLFLSLSGQIDPNTPHVHLLIEPPSLVSQPPQSNEDVSHFKKT